MLYGDGSGVITKLSAAATIKKDKSLVEIQVDDVRPFMIGDIISLAKGTAPTLDGKPQLAGVTYGDETSQVVTSKNR